MDNKYQILQTIASFVKDIPQPTQYQCLPRQLILLSSFDWGTIYSYLLVLEKEGLVRLTQADNIQISITERGLEKSAKLVSGSLLTVPRLFP
ncbi:MAG: hypothetical protein V4450_00110 [Bacteroidota bacterium]